jgi:hypothetical protein
VLLDVLSIKQPWTLCGPDEPRKSLLSLDKGLPPQVLAIKPQKVEGVKDWLPFPADQLVELANALGVSYVPIKKKSGDLQESPLGCFSFIPVAACCSKLFYRVVRLW